MAIENTLYQMLANLPSISADIGGRIYFEHNPNSTEQTYLIYQKISHQRPLEVDGSSALEIAAFQVDIYSPLEDTARNIRDNLINDLHGQANSAYADNVQLVFFDSDNTGFVNDPKLFRITLSLDLTF